MVSLLLSPLGRRETMPSKIEARIHQKLKRDIGLRTLLVASAQELADQHIIGARTELERAQMKQRIVDHLNHVNTDGTPRVSSTSSLELANQALSELPTILTARHQSQIEGVIIATIANAVNESET
jgi:hypothetical protein